MAGDLPFLRGARFLFMALVVKSFSITWGYPVTFPQTTDFPFVTSATAAAGGGRLCPGWVVPLARPGS